MRASSSKNRLLPGWFPMHAPKAREIRPLSPSIAGNTRDLRQPLLQRSSPRTAMATLAGEKGYERDPVMAHATVLSAKYFAHRYRICASLGHEWRRMTIGAIQPLRVGAMGKDDLGHLLSILHQNIEIQYGHRLCLGQSGTGRDGTGPQCRHPVGKSDRVPLEQPCRIIYFLQARKVRVRLVVDRVQ